VAGPSTPFPSLSSSGAGEVKGRSRRGRARDLVHPPSPLFSFFPLLSFDRQIVAGGADTPDTMGKGVGRATRLPRIFSPPPFTLGVDVALVNAIARGPENDDRAWCGSPIPAYILPVPPFSFPPFSPEALRDSKRGGPPAASSDDVGGDRVDALFPFFSPRGWPVGGTNDGWG